MNPKEIDRFFTGVAKEFKEPAVIILTGAAAGSLLGGARPSMDIDFGVQLRKRSPAAWKSLADAVERGKALTGVSADFSEDIDRWGSVTLLDYRKHATPYKKFGSLTVKVLEPGYWSIGKMTRYLQPDIEDMRDVFRRRKVPVEGLVRLWGKALRSSPLSDSLGQFRWQVERFLKAYGTRIWGRAFDADRAIGSFRRSAGIRTKDP